MCIGRDPLDELDLEQWRAQLAEERGPRARSPETPEQGEADGEEGAFPRPATSPPGSSPPRS